VHLLVLCARNLQSLPHQPGYHCIQHCLFVCLPYARHVHWMAADSLNRVSSFIIVFIEVPLLLRVCPTSPKFDTFIRKFGSNYMRAAIYAVMSAVQWVSLVSDATPLIAAAVVLLIASIFYALAGFKGQAFQGSKTLGGQGVAQMII